MDFQTHINQINQISLALFALFDSIFNSMLENSINALFSGGIVKCFIKFDFGDFNLFLFINIQKKWIVINPKRYFSEDLKVKCLRMVNISIILGLKCF